MSILDNARETTKVRPTVGGIFGDVDSGKTHLLATAGEVFAPERVLLVAADRNDPTLNKFSGIKVLDFMGQVGRATQKDPEPIFTALKDLDSDLRKQGSKFDFVGLDSLSKIAHAMRIQTDEYLNTPEPRQVYSRVQNQLVPIIWSMCNTAVQRNFHLWMTMWERVDFVPDPTVIPDGGYDRFFPDFSPELGRLIRHELSFLGRLTSTRSARTLGASNAGVKIAVSITTELVFAGKSIAGKNRLGFPDKVVKPTVREMLDKVGRMPTENNGADEASQELTATDSQGEEDAVSDELGESREEGSV